MIFSVTGARHSLSRRPRLEGMLRGALASIAVATLAACTAATATERRPAGAAPVVDDAGRTHYRTAAIEGVDVFYREAGHPGAPVVVLLHGFPASSHMFRDLIPALADRYHVIAPDYPGFGQSGTPDRGRFSYTFAHYAEVVDALLATLRVDRYALYVQDYGAPVGYRLALRHPERITALIIQNGNAYEEGLQDFWNPIKAYWADGSKQHREALRAGLTLDATRAQYLGGA